LTDSLVHDGVLVEYVVVRSQRRRRTLSLTLDRDGQVIVAVPMRASRAYIREFVVRSVPWIARKRAALAAAAPPQRLVSGASLLLLGREVLLEVVEATGARGSVSLEGECLRVSLPASTVDGGAPPLPNPPHPGERGHTAAARGFIQHGPTSPPGGRGVTPTPSSKEEAVRLALTRWYRQQAAERLAEDTARWAAIMEVQPTDVRVRDQKRRWGSCGSNGAIRFNFRLVMAPPELIDYVIVHELAHLRVPNHSKDFWDEVARFVPDYADRRARLNQLSPRLVI
jgi:predicted metal-dependent hydrolase